MTTHMLHKLFAWGLLADPGLPYFTGGTITEVDGYRIHTFYADDTLVVVNPGAAEVLVVGGGGSGGDGYRQVYPASPEYTMDGGGGGAGGLIYKPSYNITQDLDIKIGASDENTVISADGVDLLVALAGGKGGMRGYVAENGGSGGGGRSYSSKTAGNALQPSSASGGYGTDGQNGTTTDAGCGGSALGLTTGYTYLENVYAVGGAPGRTNPEAGAANTGNGGQGGHKAFGTGLVAGGAGGSGIVIIRYPL